MLTLIKISVPVGIITYERRKINTVENIVERFRFIVLNIKLNNCIWLIKLTLKSNIV